MSQSYKRQKPAPAVVIVLGIPVHVVQYPAELRNLRLAINKAIEKNLINWVDRRDDQIYAECSISEYSSLIDLLRPDNTWCLGVLERLQRSYVDHTNIVRYCVLDEVMLNSSTPGNRVENVSIDVVLADSNDMKGARLYVLPNCVTKGSERIYEKHRAYHIPPLMEKIPPTAFRPPKAPEFPANLFSQAVQNYLDRLNFEQRRAALGIFFELLEARKHNTIAAPSLEGMGGTGKTLVLIAVTLMLCEQGQRVLLTAWTNNAVAQLTLRLLEFIDTCGEPYREWQETSSLVVWKARMHRDTEPLHLDTQVEGIMDRYQNFQRLDQHTCLPEVLRSAAQELREAAPTCLHALLNEDDLCNRLPTLTFRTVREAILNHAKIMICTVSVAARPNLTQFLDRVDVILQDESPLVPSAATHALYSNCTKMVVFCGDSKQTLVSTQSQYNKQYGLDRSIFQDLVEAHVNRTGRYSLMEQHRCVDSIAQMLARCVYNCTVTTATSFRSPARWPLPPLIAVDHSYLEQQDRSVTTSRSNRHESQFAIRILQYLALHLPENKDPDATLPTACVVSPYADQVRNVVNLLEIQRQSEIFNFRLNVEAMGVREAQGAQFDCCILSTVRCNADGDYGFVDEGVATVGLTRARSTLVVLGSSHTARDHPVLGRVFEYIRSNHNECYLDRESLALSPPTAGTFQHSVLDVFETIPDDKVPRKPRQRRGGQRGGQLPANARAPRRGNHHKHRK